MSNNDNNKNSSIPNKGSLKRDLNNNDSKDQVLEKKGRHKPRDNS